MRTGREFLIDTSIIAQLAPHRQPISNDLARWIEENAESSFLSVVTVMELQRGAAALKFKGETARAGVLQNWIDVLAAEYGARILPVSAAVAIAAGELYGRLEARGTEPGFVDALVAATAISHGLTIVTANRQRFAPLTDNLVDPV
ncbi:twitching motility protein PilT [Aureimonas sp. SA4125]|uniref:PIN domain-containing protein n=1 Tax=Aureimonas sp. SA4125 TaxID=2826993 RepID=UPI001CC69DCD|nr:PIN domain-containing protein [Aureimonas sp. SA4125]BDA82911.1 twitching motility protein PilT [Aureimonas sp. SA4125]